jgi:hypothetical protein
VRSPWVLLWSAAPLVPGVTSLAARRETPADDESSFPFVPFIQVCPTVDGAFEGSTAVVLNAPPTVAMVTTLRAFLVGSSPYIELVARLVGLIQWRTMSLSLLSGDGHR